MEDFVFGVENPHPEAGKQYDFGTDFYCSQFPLEENERMSKVERKLRTRFLT